MPAASQIGFLSFLFTQGVGFQPAHDLLQAPARRGCDRLRQGRQHTMHVMLSNGRIEAASLFLGHEADPTAGSKDKDERIHFASRSAHVEVAHFLVEHCADVDKDGLTPLNSALFKRNLEIARFLIEHGADLSAQKKDGWMGSVHPASEGGHVEVARLLGWNDADATAQAKDGSTPLHWASFKGDVDAVPLLAHQNHSLCEKKAAPASRI